MRPLNGTYGGYMTMIGLTKVSDTWAAGVAIVPFVNWFTNMKNEDPLLREYDMSTMGDPDGPKNKQLLEGPLARRVVIALRDP